MTLQTRILGSAATLRVYMQCYNKTNQLTITEIMHYICIMFFIKSSSTNMLLVTPILLLLPNIIVLSGGSNNIVNS